jgi:hypothetical protein
LPNAGVTIKANRRTGDLCIAGRTINKGSPVGAIYPIRFEADRP